MPRSRGVFASVVCVFVFWGGFVLGSLAGSVRPARVADTPPSVTVHRQHPDGSYDVTRLRVTRISYKGEDRDVAAPGDEFTRTWRLSFEGGYTYYAEPVK